MSHFLSLTVGSSSRPQAGGDAAAGPRRAGEPGHGEAGFARTTALVRPLSPLDASLISFWLSEITALAARRKVAMARAISSLLFAARAVLPAPTAREIVNAASAATTVMSRP